MRAFISASNSRATDRNPRRNTSRSTLTLARIGAAFILTLAGCGGGSAPSPTAGAPPPVGAKPGNAPPPAMPATGASGRIKGRVVFTGDAPSPRPVAMTKDPEVCGKTQHVTEDLVVASDGGLKNAYVSIGPVSGSKPFPGGKPALDQRGCWFHPHVLVVPAGGEVDILNSDGILHNIHTNSKLNPPVNMAQPKFKKVLTVTFAKPEAIGVSCDVHNWMKAWIVVAENAYHALTGDDGGFEITDVPPGAYTLTAWHETQGTRAQPVTVPPDGAAEATLTF